MPNNFYNFTIRGTAASGLNVLCMHSMFVKSGRQLFLLFKIQFSWTTRMDNKNRMPNNTLGRKDSKSVCRFIGGILKYRSFYKLYYFDLTLRRYQTLLCIGSRINLYYTSTPTRNWIGCLRFLNWVPFLFGGMDLRIMMLPKYALISTDTQYLGYVMNKTVSSSHCQF